MKLSIIIPVYNEESTIKQVLQKLIDLYFPFDTEIIIADDGSTDRTSRIIDEFNRDNILKVHTSLINLGKGAAVRFGLEYIEGDYVIIQDADLELNPEDIVRLVQPIVRGDAEVVYGSRFKLRSQELASIPWYTILANKVLTAYTNILYACKLTDMATAYKLVKSDVIKRIKLKCIGFEFDPEVTAKIIRLGYKIVEVPISYQPRSIDEGKKIGWRDGFKFMYYLTKYRIMKKESFMKEPNSARS